MAFNKKESSFSLYIKTFEGSYILSSFEGFMLLGNMKNETEKLQITYSNYEIFHDNLLLMLDFFVEDKDFELNTNKTIFIDASKTISWSPNSKNNEKYVKLHIDDTTNSFLLEFNLDLFFGFFKAFTSCIIPSLLLYEAEKLAFQALFFNKFEWTFFDQSSFNEEYLLQYFLNFKRANNIEFDISNLISKVKYYLPILILLKKANSLLLLNLQPPSFLPVE